MFIPIADGISLIGLLVQFCIPMIAISTGIAVAGLVLGHMGQQKQAEAQKSAAKANAEIARRNARIAQQRARIRIGQLQREGVATRSTQRAITGAAGVKATGSIQTLLRETRRATSEDVAAVRLLGAQQAAELKSSAKAFTAEARAIGKAQPLIAAGTLLTGGAQILG